MLDILEEHLEELDFLWEQRESVIFAPDWNLQELAELEERAEAHLDGLRIGAGHSVEIARPALTGEEKGAATASALTMMTMDSPAQETEAVLAMAAATSPAARDGIRIALRHSDVRRVAERLAQMASVGEPAVRAAAADALAFHRLPSPSRLADLFAAPDTAVRRLGYGAAGRFGGPWSMDLLEQALGSESPDIRRTALETSARLGLPGLDAACRRIAGGRHGAVPEAVSFLGALGDPQDRTLLESCANGNAGPGVVPAALEGLGRMGNVQSVPVLLQAMVDATLARAAGAAYVRITAARGIEADAPPPSPAEVPEEDESGDDSRAPDPERARAWWERNKGRFAAHGRWQAGEEVTLGPAGPAFASLPLGIRRDLFLCARARDARRVPDIELEARAVLQLGSR